ncbi:MAG TPA: Nif11-like leader peptide family RiPP precursor [Polyangiaceae bacterium]|jgi:predicted ribosomally synthesized peptide with nif11-like leader|nr:Nif11-like leader peptide family RiPP precursor [Polyangiaceae bacterium]
MAKQDFIKFYQEYLPKHPDLKGKVDAITNPDDFAKAVLEAGPKAGFTFTKPEIESVMQASEKLVTTSELSDDMLDAVAGGAVMAAPIQAVQISSVASRLNIVNRPNIPNLGASADTSMCCW